jgi:DNA repair protein RecO (recombination protein O)
MLDKTEGIILKTTRYGETSIIAKIFTKKYGLLSFIIQGIRTAKNKQKGNLFQPLNILSLEIYLKEQRNLNRIREYAAAYIYQTLFSDFTRQSIALFCIELTSKCIREHEINERLYDYLSFFLIQLDTERTSPENKPIFFMLEIASMLGFELPAGHSADGNYFNLESGRFENEFVSKDLSLDAHETAILKKMMAVYYEKSDIKLTRAERKLVMDKLLLYFRWHIADFSELRTPAILHELLK